MPRLYNHRNKIQGYAPITRAHVLPGSMIEFKYAVQTSRDKKPIVLILANGLSDRAVNSNNNILMHGINLNYLSQYDINRMFYVIAAQPIRGADLDMMEQERDAQGRYIAESQRYTRLSLPVTIRKRNVAGARPMITEMYARMARTILGKKDAYRKYKVKEMSGIRGLKFKVPEFAR